MAYLGTKPANAPVTSDQIGDGVIQTNDLADGAVTGTKLENSGVTAGTYGSASAIPAVTVDAKGRVTSVTTNAVSGGVTSLNGQTGAITNTDYGAIGSYTIAISNDYTRDAVFEPNTTVAGSSLLRSTQPTSGNGSSLNSNGITIVVNSDSSASLGFTGTWRRMTRTRNGSTGTACGMGLFVRIS